MLLEGRGQMAIDGKVIDLVEGDAVKVRPEAKRALRSHPDEGSLWLMVGAVPGAYREDDWTEYEDEGPGF